MQQVTAAATVNKKHLKLQSISTLVKLHAWELDNPHGVAALILAQIAATGGEDTRLWAKVHVYVQ